MERTKPTRASELKELRKSTDVMEARESTRPSDFTELMQIPGRKVNHPFKCRLTESAAFIITSPKSLIGAGFASLGVGIFTIFRPSPFILQILISHSKTTSKSLEIFEVIAMVGAWSWLSIILFVLIGLGLLLLFSEKIKKRKVLLAHPWGLLILYVDIFVWLILTVILQWKLMYRPEFFAVVYIECVMYYAGYFFYATYFIAAELTVIERFY